VERVFPVEQLTSGLSRVKGWRPEKLPRAEAWLEMVSWSSVTGWSWRWSASAYRQTWSQGRKAFSWAIIL